MTGFQTTATAIKNPFIFYYVQNDDWSSSHSYQYWNKNFTSSVGIVNTSTLKTIYDPATSGFVEPMTSAFNNFTSDGSYTLNGSRFNVSGGWNEGWHFYTTGWRTGSTVFFQAPGYRDTYSGSSSTGAISYIGSYGNYWSAGASSESLGRSLGFGSDSVSPQNAGYRSYGFTCRPVSE